MKGNLGTHEWISLVLKRAIRWKIHASHTRTGFLSFFISKSVNDYVVRSLLQKNYQIIGQIKIYIYFLSITLAKNHHKLRYHLKKRIICPKSVYPRSGNERKKVGKASFKRKKIDAGSDDDQQG